MKTFLLSLAASVLLATTAVAAPLSVRHDDDDRWERKSDKKHKDGKRYDKKGHGHAYGHSHDNYGRSRQASNCNNDRRDGRYSRNDGRTSRNQGSYARRDRQGYGYDDRKVSVPDQTPSKPQPQSRPDWRVLGRN